jgi:hypothetical protein
MAADRDAQRRELEEIRRKFTEMGARVGSLFEPGPDDDHHTHDTQDTREAAPASTAPGRPGSPAPAAVSRLMAVAAVVVALLVGTGLGYVLPRAGAKDAPRVPAATSSQAPASTGVGQPGSRTVVPPACLETARKGDLTIHLYTINVRDRRLVQALKAYTLASQACRREASP